jgi:hypothetical protein
MTKAEKLHLSRVAGLGCIACRNAGHGESPAEIHHIRAGQGMGRRASNYETIPLCPLHHRAGGYGVAIHAGRAAWEHAHGAELDLLEQVRGLLSLKGAQ